MGQLNLERLGAFARAVHSGTARWRAAKLAGYTGTMKVLGTRAAELLRRPEVRAELKRLKDASDREAHLSRDELLATLAKIIRPAKRKMDTAGDCDRVSAAREYAKLMGWNAPKKIEHSGSLAGISDEALVARTEAALAALRASVPDRAVEDKKVESGP